MKLKMNVLDYIIIFIVIAVLFIGGFLFTKINKTAAVDGKEATIEFTLEVKELTEDLAKSFENAKGSDIIYGVTNSDKGVITDVKLEPCKRIAKDLINGYAFWDTIPNEYDALVTIKTTVIETEEFFEAASDEIRIGMKIPFHGNGVASADGIVLAIEKLEGGLQ